MITKKDLHFYNLSLELAKLSKCNARHGCIITYKSRPLVIAVNQPKINPFKQSNKHSISSKKFKYNESAKKRRDRQETTHAEIVAILKSRTSLEDTVLYSAHVLKNGDSGNSYPCIACMDVILFCNIKHIVYWDLHLKKIKI